MNYQGILKATILTEKAAKLSEKDNKYTFLVSRDASKGQIKEAISKIYGVKVIGVNVLNSRGKLKRSWVGKKSSFSTKDDKKAVVQLDSSDTLKIYEGAKK